MTVQELSQVYHLNREIEMNKRRLEELRAKIGATTPKLSGMPHSPNNTDSQTEQIAAEIVDLEAITKALQIQCIHERNRVMRYVTGINDSELRMIVTLRFVDGLTWEQVAFEMGEGYKTEALKKRCYYYIKHHGHDGSRKKWNKGRQ